MEAWDIWSTAGGRAPKERIHLGGKIRVARALPPAPLVLYKSSLLDDLHMVMDVSEGMDRLPAGFGTSPNGECEYTLNTCHLVQGENIIVLTGPFRSPYSLVIRGFRGLSTSATWPKPRHHTLSISITNHGETLQNS